MICILQNGTCAETAPRTPLAFNFNLVNKLQIDCGLICLIQELVLRSLQLLQAKTQHPPSAVKQQNDIFCTGYRYSVIRAVRVTYDNEYCCVVAIGAGVGSLASST